MRISIKKRNERELNLPLIYLTIFLFCFCCLYLLFTLNIIPQIPCFFKLITDHPCPTCGTTRLTESLLHFNFIQAFLFNPMIFLLGVIFILWGLYGFYQMFSGKKVVFVLTNKDWIVLRILIISIIIANWFYLELMGI